MFIYIYQEKSENSLADLFFHQVDSEIQNRLKKCFLDAGGIKISDMVISKSKRVRISVWTTAEGYSQWADYELVKNYLHERNKFNQINKIISSLYGPIEIQ